MQDYSKDDLRRMIERYTDEFNSQFIAQQNTAVSAPIPVLAPAPDTDLEPSADPPDELSDIGSLQVRVSTENQAVPLVGATVLVTRGHNGETALARAMVTDENGTTELIDLPTKDRALSLNPDNRAPYTTYTVEVAADGYYRKQFTDLPIYGGVTAIQSVSMIPLPEAASGNETLTYPQISL